MTGLALALARGRGCLPDLHRRRARVAWPAGAGRCRPSSARVAASRLARAGRAGGPPGAGAAGGHRGAGGARCPGRLRGVRRTAAGARHGRVRGLVPPRLLSRRGAARRAAAMDAWPRLLEELRILTSSLGRSIPQALFEVGRRAPEELRPAFVAAHREWLLSTDFARTLQVLKAQLADPTADAVCETLLVAHEVGGTDLDRRLEALIDDRVQDAQGRKDARAAAGRGPVRSPLRADRASGDGAGRHVGRHRPGRVPDADGPAPRRGRHRPRDRLLGVGRAGSWSSPRRSGCSMPRLLAASRRCSWPSVRPSSSPSSAGSAGSRSPSACGPTAPAASAVGVERAGSSRWRRSARSSGRWPGRSGSAWPGCSA